MSFIKKCCIIKNYNINTPIPLNTIDRFIIDEYEKDLHLFSFKTPIFKCKKV